MVIFYVYLFFYSTTQFTNLFTSSSPPLLVLMTSSKISTLEGSRRTLQHWGLWSKTQALLPLLFMDHEVFCLLSLLASWRWYQELHSLYHSICFTYGMLFLLPIPFLNNYEFPTPHNLSIFFKFWLVYSLIDDGIILKITLSLGLISPLNLKFCYFQKKRTALKLGVKYWQFSFIEYDFSKFFI